MNTIEQKVIKVLSEQLGMPEKDIQLSSTEDSLGMDSLDRIETIMALEEAFDMEISDHDAERFTDVKSVVDYIRNKSLVECTDNREANSLLQFTVLAEQDMRGRVSDLRDKLSKRKENILKKEKRPLENWIKPVSFNKIISLKKQGVHVEEVGDNMWWVEDTKCLYLHYSRENGYLSSDLDNGRFTRINFTNNPEALKLFKISAKWKEAIKWEEAINRHNISVRREVSVPKDFDYEKFSKAFRTLDESRKARESVCEEDIETVTIPEDVIQKAVNDWTDKHYDFMYKLTQEDIEKGMIKIDPYFVNELWGLNSKDSTGIIFHNLKTIARWTNKNSEEREIRALHGQIKRLAEMRGIEL